MGAGCSLSSLAGELCLSNIDDTWYGKGLELLLLGQAFGGLAAAADHLCNSLETLCDHFDVPEDVGGATFMAFGSAIPELTVNAISTAKAVMSSSSTEPVRQGEAPWYVDPSTLVFAVSRRLRARQLGSDGSQAELGVGAILGSGLIAFLVIPSVCALVSPTELRLKRRPLLRDIIAYAVASVLLLSALRKGRADLSCALSLVGCYVLYLLVVVLGRPIRLRWRRWRRAAPSGREVCLEEPATSSSSVFRARYEKQGCRDNPLESQSLELSELSESFGVQAETMGADQEEASKPDRSWLGSPFAKSASRAVHLSLRPVRAVTTSTCPDCRILARHESLYPVTFFASLSWICLHSFVITAVCGRWVERMQQPNAMGYLGLALVSVGAEVPDMAQAIAVARRGYGSMAVSSCVGSQIVNICCGLGLPWLICALTKQEVVFPGSSSFLQSASACVMLAILAQTAMLLVAVLLSRAPKATLGTRKAVVGLSLYGLALAGLSIVAWRS
ncbi:unnamed protein product [Polarella glacialis]|uniref:Sodium/calcium exchanger membrane region domain-containing protein n=1 Tax=Polarella glacialis TaxID=89957 RepID=A0A813GNN2_POLGL|nr:unnamed protein product [Polarella glacialis]